MRIAPTLAVLFALSLLLAACAKAPAPQEQSPVTDSASEAVVVESFDSQLPDQGTDDASFAELDTLDDDLTFE